MDLDPRTPVLVGVGTVSRRGEDPLAGPDAAGLMAEAAEAAGRDSGAPDLLRSAGAVLVPRGTWGHGDAGRLVAEAVGNRRARTVAAEIGVLQTTLIDRAASAIAAGGLDVALVVGGEARWRETRAAARGVTLPPPARAPGPDESLAPGTSIVGPEEVAAGLTSAVAQYALIENARRAADGQSLDAHQGRIADLWAELARVAADNPEAWNPPMTAEEIRTPGPGNRPMAFPYNKWHCSQWNVDQAAALLLCSAGAARAAGVAPGGWVFPHSAAESNHVVPLSRRAEVHRSPGFALAGRAALNLAGVSAAEVEMLELYSCFPIAVRVQQAELGIAPGRPVTVTGGMTFAGGPLNNYVLQAVAAVARRLRGAPERRAMVTAVSGLLTKQGVTIWSGSPPGQGYRSLDVSDAVAASTPSVDLPPGAAGPGAVVTYTVIAGRDGPDTGVVLVDLPGGGRALATSVDAAITADMTGSEWCGRRVTLDGRGGFSPQ